jgi:hypothetical protein
MVNCTLILKPPALFSNLECFSLLFLEKTTVVAASEENPVSRTAEDF